ncbi:MAG TPA: BatA domain-containing protein [Gemmatimonadales bacterium]
MSFLAPLWLAIAGVASGALVIAHFFARHRPRPAMLPTARFIPEAIARAPSPARLPSDLLLLLMRVLALLAIGAALARPVVSPPRRRVARVVVLDTAGAKSASLAHDSAVAMVQPGDTIVGGWEVGGLGGWEVGTLSGGLVRALRAAAALRDHADSLELVIVSPFLEASFDAATDSIRRLWPGRARLVQVAARSASAPRRISIVGAPDDPIRAPVALLGTRSGAETRVMRARPTAADSAFARGGGVLVIWPAASDGASRTDTVGAVAAGGVVVVAPFVRALRLPPSPGRAVAFWVDGVPAATERSSGTGCVRTVAIPLPTAGDLVLRQGVRGLVDALTSACGGPRNSEPAAAARLAMLRGSAGLMRASLAPAGPRRSSASAWLLGISALLLLAEMLVRPRAAS